MASSDLETAFIENFYAFAKHLGVAREELIRAEGALRAIFQPYEDTARMALLATPYFASHGPEHAVGLSSIAKRFIESFEPDSLTSTLTKPEFLVLFFGSLILHDIGMAILEDGTTALEETQKKQLARKGHDDRSLRFIEEKLLRSNPPAWVTFWEMYGRRGAGSWPTPVGKYAFYLLARICKSHGDSVSIWLSEDSFDTYTQQTDRRVLNFRSYWGTDWDNVRKIALTAAALLNLCDLCDVGDQRFRDLPEGWKELAFPEDTVQRKWSFIHWIGHQVGSVDFAEGEVILRIAGAYNRKLTEMLPLQHGPAADLVHWLSMPQLDSALKNYVSPQFGGLRIIYAATDDDTWQSISDSAFSEYLNYCWAHQELNEVLFQSNYSADRFDKVVTAPLWWLSACRTWKEELPSPEGEYFYLNLLARLKDTGHLVEDIIELPSELPEDQFLTATFSANTVDSGLYELANSFLTAIKVARELTIANPVKFRRVHFAFKGKPVFTELLDENFAKYANSLILCEVRRDPLVEIQDVEKIIEKLRQSNVPARLIFFGRKHELEALQTLGLEVVEGQGASGKISDLLSSSSIVTNTDRDEVYISISGASYPAIAVSPAEAYVHLYLRGNFPHGLIDLFGQMLRSNELQISSDTLGVVLYLTLYDFLNYSLRGVETEELRTYYDEITNLLKRRVDISLWEDSHLKIIQWGLVTEEEGKLRSDHQPTIATLRERASSHSIKAFLLQLVVIYRFQAQVRLYNFAAEPPVEVSVPNHTIQTLLLYVYDESNDEHARVALAFGFAELWGSHTVDVSLNDIADAILSHEVVSLRDGYNGLIAFQMLYRIYRATKPWLRAVKPLDHPLAKLGFLEAIASNADLQDAERSEIVEAIRVICDGFILTKLSPKTEEGIATILAYDIIWKYSEKNPSLRLGAAQFLAWGKSRGLAKLASYFHTEHPTSIPKEGNLVFSAWRDLRRRFLLLTEDLTPEELKRAGVKEEILQKAGVTID